MTDRKKEAIDVLKRYWGEGLDAVNRLPVICANSLPKDLPPKLDWCELPEWAVDCGVAGKILLPSIWAVKWEKVPFCVGRIQHIVSRYD